MTDLKELRFKNPKEVYINIDNNNYFFFGIYEKGDYLKGLGFLMEKESQANIVRKFIERKKKIVIKKE